VIDQEHVVELILEACPSFKDDWEHHAAEYGGDLLYVAAAGLARHLLLLHKSNRGDCFPAVGGVIERFHTDGSPWAQEFATIGILESIQNVWMNEGADPEEFGKWLGPESRKWWSNLNDFWSGKALYVGGQG
jgi:hypothetical protein